MTAARTRSDRGQPKAIRSVDDPAPEWRQQAACRDTDPDLFFPIGTTGPAAEQIAHAKKICASCPVRHPCGEYGLRSASNEGIWGGMTEDERRAVRRRRARARRVSPPITPLPR